MRKLEEMVPNDFLPKADELQSLLRQLFIFGKTGAEVDDLVDELVKACKHPDAAIFRLAISHKGIFTRVMKKEIFPYKNRTIWKHQIEGDGYPLKALALDISLSISAAWESDPEITKLPRTLGNIASRGFAGGTPAEEDGDSSGELRKHAPKIIFSVTRGEHCEGLQL